MQRAHQDISPPTHLRWPLCHRWTCTHHRRDRRGSGRPSRAGMHRRVHVRGLNGACVSSWRPPECLEFQESAHLQPAPSAPSVALVETAVRSALANAGPAPEFLADGAPGSGGH
eukprot:scaffold3051_cov236-Pinguiococcus_pyrenoidosus.AAC.2